MAVFMKLVMETPGISTGYWNDMKMPAQDLSSGLIARRSRPINSMLPCVTVNEGLPARTEDNVLLPAPFGPITAWISPLRMVRSMPLSISLSPTEA